MIRGLTNDEREAWLHETGRLLADLPERIVFEAIDECVKEPGRCFAPSVGEIREKAAAPLRRAEIEAANLRRMAQLIAEGAEIPEYAPPQYLDLPGKPKEAGRRSLAKPRASLPSMG